MELAGSKGVARLATHESGLGMIEFTSFHADDLSPKNIQQFCNLAANEFGQEWHWVRIHLNQSQFACRSPLEKNGFVLDGWEYGIPVKRLRASMHGNSRLIPERFRVEPTNYERDIDAVMDVETAVHTADDSTRVSLASETARQGARAYYERASTEGGVFLMWLGNKLAGIVGLREDKKHPGAVHVSSVAVALDLQVRRCPFR